MKLSTDLINWYHANKRELPWRNTNDPYIIWLSEIILQQTRVDQGLPYFYRFLDTFPDIQAFATARESTILKLWQGLGYYNRARNMFAAAKQIKKDYNGHFPVHIEELKKIKGIGDYTAAAISSFAFNQPNPVVDGNVFRFLSRYFGIETPVNTQTAKKEFLLLAREIMENKDPATFNQAIMEFGSQQCKPVSPDCSKCIFSKTCYALNNHLTDRLPVKNKSNKPRKRFFNYLFISHKGEFYIRKRTEQDIWKHLYELPLIETVKIIQPAQLLKNQVFLSLTGTNKATIVKISQFKHQLSHQTIHATFYLISSKNPLPRLIKNNYIKINADKIAEYAFPRLMEKYFNSILKEK